MRYFLFHILPNPSTRAFVQQQSACFPDALTKMRLSCSSTTYTAAQELLARPIHCTSLTLFKFLDLPVSF